ncbi:MAG: hypothetical protein J6V53_03875 [Alphaproteobacteria bacterium]|nr:hypothetical protein [Alphaproteobacteria bacterium]
MLIPGVVETYNWMKEWRYDATQPKSGFKKEPLGSHNDKSPLGSTLNLCAFQISVLTPQKAQVLEVMIDDARKGSNRAQFEIELRNFYNEHPAVERRMNSYHRQREQQERTILSIDSSLSSRNLGR